MNRRPLLLILILFVGPLAAAFWLYYGSSWRPSGRTSHGELIQPVIVLPALPKTTGDGNVLAGKWSLLVVGMGDAGCDSDCRNALIYARQTWLSLGRLASRVQRVLLAGPGCCDSGYLHQEHEGLVVAEATGGAGAALLTAIPEPRGHYVFVVDPLGNLMMRYDVRDDPKGLRVDLQKLLELSHIG
jgi:hypothetical protein